MSIELTNNGYPEIHCLFSAQENTQRLTVEYRLLGQLLQTLLYEEVVSYNVCHLNSGTTFQATGVDDNGDTVIYECSGLLSDSFQLIRLYHKTLVRISSSGERSRAHLHQMLEE